MPQIRQRERQKIPLRDLRMKRPAAYESESSEEYIDIRELKCHALSLRAEAEGAGDGVVGSLVGEELKWVSEHDNVCPDAMAIVYQCLLL